MFTVKAITTESNSIHAGTRTHTHRSTVAQEQMDFVCP